MIISVLSVIVLVMLIYKNKSAVQPGGEEANWLCFCPGLPATILMCELSSPLLQPWIFQNQQRDTHYSQPWYFFTLYKQSTFCNLFLLSAMVVQSIWKFAGGWCQSFGHSKFPMKEFLGPLIQVNNHVCECCIPSSYVTCKSNKSYGKCFMFLKEQNYTFQDKVHDYDSMVCKWWNRKKLSVLGTDNQKVNLNNNDQITPILKPDIDSPIILIPSYRKLTVIQ